LCAVCAVASGFALRTCGTDRTRWTLLYRIERLVRLMRALGCGGSGSACALGSLARLFRQHRRKQRGAGVCGQVVFGHLRFVAHSVSSSFRR
jgi:hypothetical protein